LDDIISIGLGIAGLVPGSQINKNVFMGQDRPQFISTFRAKRSHKFGHCFPSRIKIKLILIFLAPGQTFAHKIVIAFLNGLHHIGGTLIQLDNHPLYGFFSGFDNTVQIHNTITNGHLWLVFEARAILNMQ
jgi:hypothetical protein